jgi:hypothetical protein
MIFDEIKWCLIHFFQQFIGFPDDGGSVTPGKNGSKKTGDFNILHIAEPMWHGNRIIRNKRRMVIFKHFLFEKILKFSSGPERFHVNQLPDPGLQSDRRHLQYLR